MKYHIFILFLLIVACKSSVDMDNVEQREHGLSYIKGTNKLVDGQVVRKFENGRTAELNNYKAGKPIGDWYAYGYQGEVVSHGFGVDAEKYGRTQTDTDMRNSVLSINVEGDFSFATLYIDNEKIFSDPKIMVEISKRIYTDYFNQYKIDGILFFDKDHEYTISKSAIDNNNYRMDTLKVKDKKKILIR